MVRDPNDTLIFRLKNTTWRFADQEGVDPADPHYIEFLNFVNSFFKLSKESEPFIISKSENAREGYSKSPDSTNIEELMFNTTQSQRSAPRKRS